VSTSSPSAFHTLEQTGWEQAAAAYDDAFARLTSQSIPALIDALELKPGARMLDICCGPGYVAAEGARKGAQVTGLDFSAAMIARAKAHYPQPQFQQGDAQALPFADACFDAVSMNYGLLHLDQPERALAEVARVLRPGGRFAFTVWAPPDQTLGFQLVLGSIEAHGRMDVPLPPGPPFFQFSDPATVRKALEAVGLREVQSTIVPQVWRFARAEEIFDTMMDGTVRTAALLRAQSPEALDKIRSAIASKAKAFATADGLELPMPSVLSSGRKPS
jgi:ubiquinone/menaquinone biosynthesis C-methylase UbiE